MKRATIDASVVIARLLHEPRPPWVDELISDVAQGTTKLVAPTLLWLEVGNRLARDKDLTEERALDGLLRIEAFSIEAVEVETPLRLRALQLARENGLTMYDSTYLAVAEAARAPLLTLDQGLERVAEAIGLGRQGGTDRISEPRAPYGRSDIDRVSLAAIGATLAELRKQYERA